MAQPKSKNDDLLLKNLVPLNTLTDEQLDQLMSHTVVEKAKKRAYLFREGDTEHQNVYLLSGTVALLSGQKEMDTVVSGTQAARFALAHQLPRKHSARAKTAVTFVRIDSRRLSDLLAHTQSASYVVNESGSPGKNDWMSLLLRSTVFQQIPPANLQRVMISMQEVEVSADDVIIQQGDEGDYFYLISNGLCRVIRQPAADHPPVELAQLKAGQGFGEEALISDLPRSSTVTMLTDGVLVRLNKKDFVELVKQPLWSKVDYAEACKKAEENATWLDVRTPEEYTAGHIPGAINIPFYALRFQVSSLADNGTYLVYGVEGGQSAIAAYLLIEREHEVFVLDQGWGELSSLAGLTGAEPASSLDNVIDINRDAGSIEEMDSVPGAPRSAEAQEAIGNLQQQLRDARQDYEKKLNQQQTEFSLLKQDLGVAKHDLELQEQKARTARDELNQEIEDLRNSLKTAKKAVSDIAEREQNEQKLTRQLAKHKQQLARLKDELNSTAETTERLQSERERLQAELETSQRQAADDLAEQERQRKALQQQLEAAQSDSQTGQRQTAEAMAGLQDELAAAQTQLAEMQGALETAQRETRTSQEALEQARSDLQRQNDQRTELEAQLEQQHQTVAFLKRSLETAEEAVEITDKTADEISQESQEAKRQLQDLQGDMASLKAEKADLEQQQADTQASLEAAETSQREVTAALQQQIEEQEQALEKSRVELQQAQQQNETAAKQQVELAAVQAGKAELEQQLADARSALEASEASGREATANLQQQVEQLQQSFETSAAELQQAQQQNAKAAKQEAELAAMQAGKAELAQLLADARSALEASEASGREATANLQQQVEQLQRSLEATAAELQQAQQQSEQAAKQEAELAAMQAGKAELEQRLADAKSRLESKNQVFDSASAEQKLQIEQLQSELAAAREQLDATARAGDPDTASARELREAQQQISELKKTIDGLREVQLEMENQFSEDSSEELRGLRARLEMEEKKRRKAESLARQTDVLRREREVQETAVEMLGEDLENLTLENQRLQAEKEALASQLSGVSNLPGDSEMAGGHSTQLEELRQNAGLIEKERDEAKAEAARMKGEVLELRCVIETYVKQIQDVQSMGSVDEISALTSELDMVRRQASEDLEHMRQQLAKAQSKSADSVHREVNEAASLQALRQEIDSQQKALNEREQLLRLSQTQCRTLEDAIEDRDKEVDQLRRKLELLLRKTGGLNAHSVRQDTDPLIDSRLLSDDSEDISSHLQEGLMQGQRQAGDKGRTKLGRLFRKK